MTTEFVSRRIQMPAEKFCSPRRYVRALLSRSGSRRRTGTQAAHDPGARLRRVDDIVDLQERRHAQRLAALVEVGDQPVVSGLALSLVGDCRKLVTVGE